MDECPNESCKELREDFCKCYEIALLASSYWAENPEVFVGTVSERLSKLLTLEHNGRLEAESKLARLANLGIDF